jgi:hypothetical protein
MPTLSTVPAYPPPNWETRVTFTLTESGTNWVRVWVTAAPEGSELRAKLDAKAALNRFEVYAGPGGANALWKQTFGVGGKYTLVAQEYTRGATEFGGGYQNDARGAQTETKVGAESTLSLHIGQRLTSTISAGADSVDLALWVWDATIRATTIEPHGEVSPAITKDTPNARELAAIESTAVQTALTALVGQTAATAIGAAATVLSASAGGFIKEWNDHLADAAVHQDADPDNLIPVGLASAASAGNLADVITAILPYITYHYTNDAVKGGTAVGIDSADYHNVSGKRNDNTNAPIVKSVSSPSDAYWACADLWRSYEAHRVSASPSGVHDSADSTNVLTALPALLGVAYQVFTVWASIAPTVPDTQSTGAMHLIAKAGFTEEPL